MHVRKGRVRGGVIVPEDARGLEEGDEVEIRLVDSDDDANLTPDQEAELVESIAECERGESMDAFEFLAELRSKPT